MTRADVEVAVVGGGPVGTVLALALERAGVSTALVEARTPPRWQRDEMDLRVYALSRASQNILYRLGAWERIAAARTCAYRAMEVWDAEGTGRVHFDAADVDEPDLGHIVEGTLVGSALVERVRASTGIAWHCPVALERLEVAEDCVELFLEGGGRLTALLAVGADGARSRVRTLAGIKAQESSYGQSAVVAHLQPTKMHEAVARQVFHHTGPLALLPLDDGRVSIVWSTDPNEAERLMGVNDRVFEERVTAASEEVLGALTLASPRASFPLVRLHAESYIAPRVALVGDAAHVVHPLAGQGMNLGLLDAAALADVIREGRRSGSDVDDYLVLRRYERWRHGENLAAQGTLGGFKEMFGSDKRGVRTMRGVGMRLFDRTGPAKRLAIRIALGMAGDLPELASAIAE